MYRIQMQVINPMTGESRLLNFQFDSATASEGDWTAAWPAVRVAIDSLVQSGATSEPVTLAAAASKLPAFN